MAESKTTLAECSIAKPSGFLKHSEDSPLWQNSSYKDGSGLVLLQQTVPELLFDQARTRPGYLAIDSYDCRMSYSKLAHEVNATSTRLYNNGVRSEQKIGICFHLSAKAVVTILALLHLGAAVVPVDPLHPAARRRVMLLEAEINQLVVGDSNFIAEFDKDFPLIDLSGLNFGDGRTPESARPTSTMAKVDGVAFIPFTSGSTGKPKGILQPHNSLVTMSKELAMQMKVDDTSRVAQFHPYIFDVSIMEITMTLTTGATLCISKKDDMMLPTSGEVSHQLTRSGITHVTLSPTMLNTMDPNDVPTVKVLCAMGEPLGRSAIAKWHSRPERAFLQLWGCTEACILQSITSPITSKSSPQNIGRAMEDVCRLWVIDPDDVNRLQPRGSVGELVVESRALAKGYLNRPAETAKAFLDDVAWRPRASQGHFYRTGDLAREEEDGSISFIGRVDTQMNYHGERIELGEIDYYLDRCRPTKDLDCFADFDQSSQTVVGFVCGSVKGTSGPELISWSEAVTTKSTASRMTEQLKNNGELPEYMVPHFWLPISRRPLTASGKTDRSCLRQLMQSLSSEQWSDCDVRESNE